MSSKQLTAFVAGLCQRFASVEIVEDNAAIAHRLHRTSGSQSCRCDDRSNDGEESSVKCQTCRTSHRSSKSRWQATPDRSVECTRPLLSSSLPRLPRRRSSLECVVPRFPQRRGSLICQQHPTPSSCRNFTNDDALTSSSGQPQRLTGNSKHADEDRLPGECRFALPSHLTPVRWTPIAHIA